MSTATPTARQSDLAAITSVVEQAYAALAFEPGSQPDWDTFGAVFHPQAILALRVFPSDDAVRVMRLAEYVQAQMEKDLSAQGYSESPGERSVQIHGDTAVVRQQFAMNFAGTEPVPALDIFSLARLGGRWIIVCVISDLQQPHQDHGQAPYGGAQL